MQLSMYMVAQWLDGYGPVATILSRKRDIAGARLFEDGIPFDPAVLYVGRTDDFFPDSASSAVMAVHGNDVLAVQTDDLNKVFNSVLGAFDHYDAIEREIGLAMQGPAPEQGVISAFEDLLGPTFIMTRDYRILACSQNFANVSVNKLWEEFAAEREPGLASVKRMQGSEVVTKILLREPSMKRFREPEAAPYCYGLANTYRRADGSVIGHLIIASDKDITPFEVDLASIIMETLGKVQARLGNAATGDLRERGDALLANLVAGRDVASSAQKLAVICGFEYGASFRLMRIERYDESILQVLMGAVRRMAPHSVASAHDGGITVLAWGESSNLPEMSDLCVWLGSQHPLKTGISNAFEGLENCMLAYDKSRYALERGRSAGVFAKCACEYLLSDKSPAAKRLARHPIVPALERFDEEHKSELVATLREYLLCERSVKIAAERLFVHKNTVMYRIGQVKEFDMIDFDDVQERVYALVSLLI